MDLRELRTKRIVEGWLVPNDGTRPLLESIVVPEVQVALQDWAKASTSGVLIGGLALSYWGLPRYTTDVDYLFALASDIPTTISGFKRVRSHSFQHNATHVEVLDAAYLKMDPALATKIIQDAVLTDGIRVASPSGLVASKLNRFNKYDQGDIEQLYKAGKVDLTGYPLTVEMKQKYDQLLADL